MNVEEFRDYCLSLPGVAEKMPFPTVNDPYSRSVSMWDQSGSAM